MKLAKTTLGHDRLLWVLFAAKIPGWAFTSLSVALAATLALFWVGYGVSRLLLRTPSRRRTGAGV